MTGAIVQIAETVGSLVAAYVLAMPLGYEREARSEAGVGLRTLPLVAVGSCAYLLMSRYLYEDGVFTADGVARSLRAMMTGIGFIGGGAIVKHAKQDSVAGLTTGVSVWTAGGIGAAVAHAYYEIAVILAATSLLAIDLTRRLGKRIHAKGEEDEPDEQAPRDDED